MGFFCRPRAQVIGLRSTVNTNCLLLSITCSVTILRWCSYDYQLYYIFNGLHIIPFRKDFQIFWNYFGLIYWLEPLIEWKARMHYWWQYKKNRSASNLSSYNCFIRYDTVYILRSKISHSKYRPWFTFLNDLTNLILQLLGCCCCLDSRRQEAIKIDKLFQAQLNNYVTRGSSGKRFFKSC